MERLHDMHDHARYIQPGRWVVLMDDTLWFTERPSFETKSHALRALVQMTRDTRITPTAKRIATGVYEYRLPYTRVRYTVVKLTAENTRTFRARLMHQSRELVVS